MKRIWGEKLWVLLIVIGLLFYGLLLRFYSLDFQSFWIDEGYVVLAIKSLIGQGEFGVDVMKYCPTYCYSSHFLISILNLSLENPATFRAFSAICGALFIPIFYLMIKRMFNYRVAILGAMFVSFSYIHIAWSRQARWYSLFEMLFYLSLFSFYMIWANEKRKHFWVIATIVFTFLAIMTQRSAIILIVIYVGWLIYQVIYKIKINNFHSAVVSIVITFLSVIIFAGEDIFFFIKNLTPTYSLNYYLSYYLSEYLILLIVAIIFINIFELNRKIKYSLNYLLLATLVNFVLIGLSGVVNYRYLFHLVPVLFICLAVGLDIALVKSLKIGSALTLLILVIFFISGKGVIIPQAKYFLESDIPDKINSRPFYAYTPQPDWRRAYQSIEDNLKKDDVIISSNPVMTQVYLETSGILLDILEERASDDRYLKITAIRTISELRSVSGLRNGYLVFDQMAYGNISGKEEFDNFVRGLDCNVFEENPYSKITVCKI